MATFAPAELVPVTTLGISAAVLYTASSATAIFRKASAVNRGGTPATITLYKVPASGSPALGNLIISARTLAVGESWIINELNGMVFSPGETLQGLSNVATSINFLASGVLYTP
jgi:hypothetical protein